MSHMIFVAILSVAIIYTGLNKFNEAMERNRQAAIIGGWISSVVRGYTAKAINEESGDGTYMGELALTDGATWTVSGTDLIYYLMSDGSSGDPNQEACTNNAGVTVGKSPYSYVPCGTYEFMPYGGTDENSVTFTRKATALIRPGYKTGFSQITAEFVFGGEDANDNFTIEEDGLDEVLLADAIMGWLSVSGYYPDFNDTTLRTLTQEPVISYAQNINGGITASIEFMTGNQMAITKDGAVPFEGDQSMGLNNLTDVGELYWGTTVVGDNVSTLDENGDIILYGEGSAIHFDDTGNNKIELTSNGIRFTTDSFYSSGTITSGDDVVIENSGARLANATQQRGYVVNGGDVDFPTCKTSGNEEITVAPPAIFAQDPTDPEPLYGFHADISRGTDKWTVTYYAMVEGDASRSLSSETLIPFQTWCNE